MRTFIATFKSVFSTILPSKIFFNGVTFYTLKFKDNKFRGSEYSIKGYEIKKLFLFIFCFILLKFTHAQINCPNNFYHHEVRQPVYNSQVDIDACIETKPLMGVQRVFWTAQNLTNDRLYIKFTKVVYTTCGNVIRGKADTYLDPGETAKGSSFSGEVTFETQIWDKDCGDKNNKIYRVDYEDLIIENLSKKGR